MKLDFDTIMLDISIHSLHTEGDFQIFLIASHAPEFQSTPSTRRETNFRV